MSNWVKFSDRLPTESDLNSEGEVFIVYEDGTQSIANWDYIQEDLSQCYGWFWLAGVPKPPKPRTLEDVIGEMLRYIERVGVSGSDWCNDLVNEMREITERKDDE